MARLAKWVAREEFSGEIEVCIITTKVLSVKFAISPLHNETLLGTYLSLWDQGNIGVKWYKRTNC